MYVWRWANQFREAVTKEGNSSSGPSPSLTSTADFQLLIGIKKNESLQIYDGAVCISHCITEVKRILMKETWIFRMLLKVKKKKWEIYLCHPYKTC